MPDIDLQMEIKAPAACVWQAVVDIEGYPEAMENVRRVEIIEEHGPAMRKSAWSVTLKGSILEWEEIERIDRQRMRMTFNQLSGDMEMLDGEWRVESRGDHDTHVRLGMSFEIGIPLLADMLNPVAERSLHDNCLEMLLGVEREALRSV